MLAASDGSAQGQRALCAALEIALPCALSLTLVHVLPVLHAVPADQQSAYQEQAAQDADVARAFLQPVYTRALALGLPCAIELIPGNEPWRVIDDRAESLGCDLLVLGLHMRSWLGDSGTENQRKLLSIGSTREVLMVP